ncbi:hypothetical protein PssB301D_03412 [Pseudomonas syringae pv. syringae str. B301D-R]|nr:hypothetical protein PsyrB_06335 [Pseudomonas syringae pv. syringae B301D]EXL30190.1 hypothetical protein PssB301D_03412 [Pseudomonas syringae pv. syringae str. B301D-R]
MHQPSPIPCVLSPATDCVLQDAPILLEACRSQLSAAPKKDRPICTGAVFFSLGCYLLSQMIQACQYQFVSADIIQIGDGMGGVAHRVPHDEITPHIQEQKVVIESFGF